MGVKEKARECFEKALKSMPENEDNIHLQSRCYFSLGCMYFDLREETKGVYHLEKSLGFFLRFRTTPRIDLVRHSLIL
jgi:hypothetical protein